MKIEVVGQIWKSEANGQVYLRGGLSPTLCVGAHSGVSPKIIEVYEDDNLCDEGQGRRVRDEGFVAHYP